MNKEYWDGADGKIERIKIFNNDNLTTAIKSCYEKPRYNLLIVAPKLVMPVGLIVIDCISKLYPHERGYFKISNDFAIFPNGSYIKIINQKSTARGYRVHEILMSDLSNEELIQVLAPMLRDYEEDQHMWLN